MRVVVGFAGPETDGEAERQFEVSVELPEPATLKMAIDAACVKVPEIAKTAASAAAVGVWGKVRPSDYLLREGDRVELYRSLQANPKDARRANAERSPLKPKKS